MIEIFSAMQSGKYSVPDVRTAACVKSPLKQQSDILGTQTHCPGHLSVAGPRTAICGTVLCIGLQVESHLSTMSL